jgi:hypothetical protein
MGAHRGPPWSRTPLPADRQAAGRLREPVLERVHVVRHRGVRCYGEPLARVGVGRTSSNRRTRTAVRRTDFAQVRMVTRGRRLPARAEGEIKTDSGVGARLRESWHRLLEENERRQGRRVRAPTPQSLLFRIVTWARLMWLMAVLLVVGVAVYAVVHPDNGSKGLYGLAALGLVVLVGRRPKRESSRVDPPPSDGSGPGGP